MPTKTKDIFKIYLSHAIMGKNGADATEAEIQTNIDTALKVGKELKAYFIDWQKMDGYPEIQLYVPAEHEEFVQRAYKMGFMTITEILAVDCDIINTCDLLLVYGDYLSSGMKVEIEYADKNKIPILNFCRLMPVVVDSIKAVINMIYQY